MRFWVRVRIRIGVTIGVRIRVGVRKRIGVRIRVGVGIKEHKVGLVSTYILLYICGMFLIFICQILQV